MSSWNKKCTDCHENHECMYIEEGTVELCEYVKSYQEEDAEKLDVYD